MSVKSEVLNRQLNWAYSQGLDPDDRGYLSSYEKNLFQPLNEQSKLAFDNGSGSELLDQPARPAKMRALHSSSALAANFFDTWVGVDVAPLMKILGLDSEASSIRFEGQYPTGLPGNPPNLDVVLELQDGLVVGIESKFTEWFTPKSATRPAFKDKYFPAGIGVWEKVGLPETQRLADEMQANAVTFRFLDAPQLMKHALGMATHHCSGFELLYVYFDAEGSEGTAHRSEITYFSNLLNVELGFRAYSYQELIAALQSMPRVLEWQHSPGHFFYAASNHRVS